MNVARFELERCPRATTRAATATRQAARFLATLPSCWHTVVQPLGEVTTTIEYVGGPIEGEAPTFGILLGRNHGRLTVDAPFAARLVDTALAGRTTFSVARPLGPAERGVLAALLARPLEKTGWIIGLGLAPRMAPDALAIGLRLDTSVGAGRLHLIVGGEPAIGTGILHSERRAEAARLTIVARLEIGRTRLRVRDVAELSVGDTVVFDGHPIGDFEAGASWPAVAAIGAPADEHRLRISIDAAGTITVVGGLVAERDDMDDATIVDDTLNGSAALAGVAVEVVAELGRVMLRSDELVGLAPGVVLALAAGRGRVLLRVGGEPLAQGEIVDVDGELGVRVTRLMRR